MRAVNLIPSDERRGAGGAGGRTGGGAHVLLGALAVLVAMVATYTLTAKAVNDRTAKLADVQSRAVAAEARSTSLSGYTAFRQMRAQRVATVKSIAESRFDWTHAMHEVARTLPVDAALNSLRGTVTSGVPLTGGTTVSIRSALPDDPAIEMAGCVPDQGSLAHMLVDLRRMDGVNRVTLQQSVRSDTLGAASAPAASGAGSTVTPANCDRQFQIVVFYNPVAAVTPPATATNPATAATAPTTTGATQ